ncbi:Protein of unknown function [Gryllus bimaculatus]|nr:Protein of unknown function [Gryllus bimaculatus]
MAISTTVLPSKCCGCSLRTSSISIGYFTLVISITFLGLTAAGGSLLNKHFCSGAEINGAWQSVCINTSETHKLVVNLVAILAMLNATEAVLSIGLIWGATKRLESWVSGWIAVTTFWIVLHSTLAIAYAFAARDGWVITLTAVLGIFFLGTALLAMLTVLSYRKEMLNSSFRYAVLGEPDSGFHGVSAPILQTNNILGTKAFPEGVCDETNSKMFTSENEVVK